jgi:arylsulfatase A-like enzyme
MHTPAPARPPSPIQAKVRLLVLLATLFVAPAPAYSQSAGTTTPVRPNILFIFADDHATQAIGAYGSVINETPNIDRLAREGVLFRNSFCANSICAPSRATVLTGLHSAANGVLRNGNTFDSSRPTFPQALQAAGYSTALIGKWHLAGDPSGFDFWRVLPGQGQYYNPDFRTPEGVVRLAGHVTALTTDLALDWLESGRDPDQPFLLMCQHKAPHRSWMPGPDELGLYRDGDLPEPPTLFDDYSGRGAPAAEQEMEIARHLFTHYDLKLDLPQDPSSLEGPDSWVEGMRARLSAEQLAAWDAAYAAENAAFGADPPKGNALVRWKYQRYVKNYLRCVAGVDRSVGQLLDWLDEHPEIAANTVVVYSSDQGFYLGEHGWYDKRWMYEQSLAMPLIVRWPGGGPTGSEVRALVQNIDYAPTLLELAGVTPDMPLHGRSLVPLLRGEVPDDWRDAIYYRYAESHAVHNVAAHVGVRTARYKLMHFHEPEHDSWELYDLETDPLELHSLADDPAYTHIREGLERRLAELQAEFGEEQD